MRFYCDLGDTDTLTQESALRRAVALLFILSSTGVPACAATNENPIDLSITTGEDSHVGTLDGSAVQSHTIIDSSVLGTDRTGTFALRANTFIGKVTAHWPHKSGSQASAHVTWELKWGSAPLLRTASELWSYSNGSWVKCISATATIWPSNTQGASRRGRAAVARVNCKGSKSTQWFIVGKLYAPGTTKHYGTHRSATRTLN